MLFLQHAPRYVGREEYPGRVVAAEALGIDEDGVDVLAGEFEVLGFET